MSTERDVFEGKNFVKSYHDAVITVAASFFFILFLKRFSHGYGVSAWICTQIKTIPCQFWKVFDFVVKNFIKTIRNNEPALHAVKFNRFQLAIDFLLKAF